MSNGRARGGWWRRRLRNVGVRLLVLYWATCLWVILSGVNQAYPDLWAGVRRALPGPVADRPFASCGAARAAGVSDIPFWSPAYSSDQDGDGDGWACEPPRGLRGR